LNALMTIALLLGGADIANATAVSFDFYEYRVLFDVDSNDATGCDVAAHDANFAGPVPGVEYVLTALVQRFETGALVDAVYLRKCISGTTFDDPELVSNGNWNAGLENGIGGADIVEFFVPRDSVGNPASVNLGFHARVAAVMTNDVLLTKDGQNDGEQIILDLRPEQTAPVLSSAALALCIALLAALAAYRLRRHRPAAAIAAAIALVSLVATASAVTIQLDGNVGDWATTMPAGTDVIGDSSINDPAEDIVAAFATFDAQKIYFRMDLVNLAPTVCGNDILEPGEQCEDASDCFIHFEADCEVGGGAQDANSPAECECLGCVCQGACSPC
jgi:hypothetical protein